MSTTCRMQFGNGGSCVKFQQSKGPCSRTSCSFCSAPVLSTFLLMVLSLQNLLSADQNWFTCCFLHHALCRVGNRGMSTGWDRSMCCQLLRGSGRRWQCPVAELKLSHPWPDPPSKLFFPVVWVQEFLGCGVLGPFFVQHNLWPRAAAMGFSLPGELTHELFCSDSRSQRVQGMEILFWANRSSQVWNQLQEELKGCQCWGLCFPSPGLWSCTEPAALTWATFRELLSFHPSVTPIYFPSSLIN